MGAQNLRPMKMVETMLKTLQYPGVQTCHACTRKESCPPFRGAGHTGGIQNTSQADDEKIEKELEVYTRMRKPRDPPPVRQDAMDEPGGKEKA